MSNDGFVPDAVASNDGFVADSPGPSNAGLYDLGQKISRGLKFINNPGGENAVPRGTNVLEPGGNNLFERMGGATSEYLGRKGVNPYVSAGVGTLISIANPESWMTPKVGNTRILEPRPSPETSFGVASATKHGIPLTRAEITGSKPSAMGEVGLRSTVTGSMPFENVDRTQSAALSSAEEAIRRQHGTVEPASSSGMEGKIGLQTEMGANKAMAEKLYKNIPDLPIESPNLQEHLRMSVFDADALGDPKVSKALQQARNLIERPSGQTESTFPQSFGSKTIKKDIPARTEGVGFTKMDIPASSENVPIESQYRIGPSIPAKKGPPTFQELNKLRNDLAYQLKKETTWSPITGPQISPSGQKILSIKEAIDKDVNAFAETNIGKYTEFGSAFQKAKGFYGDYANLKNNKLVRKLGNSPESDMAQTIFGKGTVENVRVAKSALGEEGFKAVQDQYFSSLLDQKNIANKLGKLDSDFMQESLRSEQLQALREVDAFRKTAKGAERMAGNTSRTAQTGATIGTGVVLYRILKGAFTNPVDALLQTAEVLGLPYLASKAYLATGSGITLPTKMASKAVNPLLLGQNRRNYE